MEIEGQLGQRVEAVLRMSHGWREGATNLPPARIMGKGACVVSLVAWGSLYVMPLLVSHCVLDDIKRIHSSALRQPMLLFLRGRDVSTKT